ncbi:MAG: hypothetical protein ACI8RZ_006337 [Myxococcota bacterium]|jgi:hypothetical protein
MDPARLSRIARLTGGLLLLMAVVAIFAQVGVRGTLVVPGDAAQTADLIGAQTGFFRLGLMGFLTAFLLDVPVAVLLHELLKPVNRLGSSLALAFRLVYTAVVAAALMPWLAALILLEDGSWSAFEPAQIHQMVLFCMELFDRGFTLALMFFGLHLALLGPLLFRSGRVPRALGVLVGLGGLAYVADSVAAVVAPDLRPMLLPVVATLGMAELLLALWLVVRGWAAPRTGV